MEKDVKRGSQQKDTRLEQIFLTSVQNSTRFALLAATIASFGLSISQQYQQLLIHLDSYPNLTFR